MNSAPIVSVLDSQTVFLNSPIQASALFSVTDTDGDAITMYRFTDFSGGAETGQFRLGGVLQGNGTTVTINAGQLGSLVYLGGNAIRNEGIRIEAFDGTDWSLPAEFQLYTVRTNDTAPVMTSTNSQVLANESIAASEFINAFDPDGYPIQKFFLRDRFVNGSFFSLDGDALAQGAYHTIQAADMGRLMFNGVGINTDVIDAFAWDGAAWSQASSTTVDTVGNFNRPTIGFNEKTIASRTTTSLIDLLNVADADGNTIKKIRFFDTSPHEFSGYLVRDGIAQPSKQWIQVDFNQAATVQFVGADRNFDEQIRVRIWDGKFWSSNQTLIVHSVAAPGLGSDLQLEFEQGNAVRLNEIFTQSDNGPTPDVYEIVDLSEKIDEGTDITGYLQVSGQKLSVGEVRQVSGQVFENNTFYVSGLYQDRSIDEIYARSFNGSYWSAWSKVTIRTEPEFEDANKMPSQLNPNEYRNWIEYYNLLGREDPYQMTYSFMQDFPAGDGAAPDDVPEETFGVLNSVQRDGARRSLQRIADVSGVTFTEISDSFIDPDTFQRGGDIRFGTYFLDSPIIAQVTDFPNFGGGAGDVWMNLFWMSQDQYDYGDDDFATLLHELGHSMGLKHVDQPFPRLPDATADPRFSVMNASAQPDPQPWGMMLYDIQSLQDLYGPNEGFNSGDTVYSVEEFWNGRTDFFESIWDAGGIDTLSAAGLSQSAVLDLRGGGLSSIGQADNVSIAFDSIIENAMGGANADQIIGNQFNNMLNGSAGNDSLVGGIGNDLLTGGRDNDLFIWGIGDGNDIIFEDKQAGRDTLEIGEFPTLTSFEDNLKFRTTGRDLIVDLTLDNGVVQNSMRITNQRWGSWQVESLEIGNQRVDLTNLYSQATPESQSFKTINESSVYGSLVIPT